MAETSGHAVTFEEIDAHAEALFQLMPKGPPEWAHHDLTFGQLRLLFLLGQSGPVSIGQLADMLGVADATASEFVDRVERRGLAIRSHRADDRRVVDCRLSEEGARLLAEIQGARQGAMRQVFALLTPEELADFDHLLRIMAERLSAAIQSSASTEGGTQVNLGRPPASPAGDAGGGPA
ncbi:MAG: MarR family transcriptional regulator [Candidatus Limnocylindrales bacterium]|jgi:DNA-binding MarR family transcriptional regulator